MIYEDKGILDSTMLKIVSKVLKNNTAPVKGFKVNTLANGKVTVTYDEVIQFVDLLADEMKKGNYDQLRKCETCANYAYPGRPGGTGWCSPTNFTSTRKNNDYCSGWVPMTPTQAETRRRVNVWHIQTQRTGDGSKDSKEGS